MIYTVEEKEEIFRNIWTNVFRISPQEHQQYDKENETTVNNYINNNEADILPYQQANPNNLNTDPYYTAQITLDEVKQTIKQLKNNTPGATKINKAILQNLPHNAIATYTKLINSFFSGLLSTLILTRKNHTHPQTK